MRHAELAMGVEKLVNQNQKRNGMEAGMSKK
jgi:hypothetical protein